MSLTVNAKREAAANILDALLKEIGYYRKSLSDPYMCSIRSTFSFNDINYLALVPSNSAIYADHRLPFAYLHMDDREEYTKEKNKLFAFTRLFSQLFKVAYLANVDSTEPFIRPPFSWSISSELKSLIEAEEIPLTETDKRVIYELFVDHTYNRRALKILKTFFRSHYEEALDNSINVNGFYINEKYYRLALYNRTNENVIRMEEFLTISDETVDEAIARSQFGNAGSTLRTNFFADFEAAADDTEEESYSLDGEEGPRPDEELRPARVQPVPVPTSRDVAIQQAIANAERVLSETNRSTGITSSRTLYYDYGSSPVLEFNTDTTSRTVETDTVTW